MCTWITEKVQLKGSGKGVKGWFPITEARVYYDHPYFTHEDHTLNIDFFIHGIVVGFFKTIFNSFFAFEIFFLEL